MSLIELSRTGNQGKKDGVLYRIAFAYISYNK